MCAGARPARSVSAAGESMKRSRSPGGPCVFGQVGLRCSRSESTAVERHTEEGLLLVQHRQRTGADLLPPPFTDRSPTTLGFRALLAPCFRSRPTRGQEPNLPHRTSASFAHGAAIFPSRECQSHRVQTASSALIGFGTVSPPVQRMKEAYARFDAVGQISRRPPILLGRRGAKWGIDCATRPPSTSSGRR